jgi:hypothetical protein
MKKIKAFFDSPWYYLILAVAYAFFGYFILMSSILNNFIGVITLILICAAVSCWSILAIKGFLLQRNK